MSETFSCPLEGLLACVTNIQPSASKVFLNNSPNFQHIIHYPQLGFTFIFTEVAFFSIRPLIEVLNSISPSINP